MQCVRDMGGGINLKALMVEDEELTREGLRTSIPWKSIGITEVHMAEDGEEGLHKAIEIQPDIIMADVRMPHLDGITMAFEVRKVLKNCKFIFISGYCDKEYLKSAIELSAVNYIEKPIEPTEVLDALKKSILQIENDRRVEKIEQEYQNKIHGFIIEDEAEVSPAWQSSMQMADKIEHYIQRNFADFNLSLTMLADHFNLTKQYICWLYKKERKETINQCIIRTRLRCAKDFMRRNPYVKVKDVANKVGFVDSNYFIKVYKRYESITPADFIKDLNINELRKKKN